MIRLERRSWMLSGVRLASVLLTLLIAPILCGQQYDLAVVSVVAPSAVSVGSAGTFGVNLGGTAGASGVIVTVAFTPAVTYNGSLSSSGCAANTASADPVTTVVCP